MMQLLTMKNRTSILEKIIVSHEEKLESTRIHLSHGGNFEIWLAPYGVFLALVALLISAMFAFQIYGRRYSSQYCIINGDTV